MPVKREYSESASPPSSPLVTPKSEGFSDGDNEYAPSPPSSPTPKRSSAKKRARLTPAKPPRTPSKSSHGSGAGAAAPVGKKDWEPGWSADKKEAIVAKYLSAGIKALSTAQMCKEFNLTSAQLSNAIQHGHKGNLRDKAAKGAR